MEQSIVFDRILFAITGAMLWFSIYGLSTIFIIYFINKLLT